MAKFQIGDKVQIVLLLKSPVEDENWLLVERKEGRAIFAGRELTVRGIDNGWLKFEELAYSHPSEKFSTITKHMASLRAQVGQIDKVYGELREARNTIDVLRDENKRLALENSILRGEVAGLKRQISK